VPAEKAVLTAPAHAAPVESQALVGPSAAGKPAAQRHVLLKINIPFCVRKCDFCTQNVIEGWDSQRLHAYMQALQRELMANAEQFSDCIVDAIRLGGGIASNANGQDISDTLGIIRQNYHLADDTPISMRSTVANFSGASMPYFKRAGITRFDLEMLSLEPVGFSRLNTMENLGDFPVVCEYFLRSYANDNLGLVLIYGSADVDSISLRRSLLALVRSHAVHLILQRCSGEAAMDDVVAEAQLTEARSLLAKHGFGEYIPLRFAKPGHEDAFFADQAKGQETLGFGLGAKTWIDGVISTNIDDLEIYLEHSNDFSKITAAICSGTMQLFRGTV
jgi:oxygen-independent coproporphyrinogen-3 oxidase